MRTWLPRERTLRLASGVLLFVFVGMHALNHALLLVSVGAAEAGRVAFQTVWRSLPGTLALYGAIAVHFALSLRALHRRRTLRMPLRDAVQIALGLSLPFLLIGHVTATRLASEASGIDVTYPEIVYALFVANPSAGLQQGATLVIAWVHGAIGLAMWLRLRRFYPALAPYFLVAAVLVPTLALLGVATESRFLALAAPPVSASPFPRMASVPEWVRPALYAGFSAGILLVVLGRFAGWLAARRHLVRIRYAGGQLVVVPRGTSVLEASRLGGVPHYAVCGGKGRCSTCRVEVLAGLLALPPAGEAERATLARLGAGPTVRLACQLRPLKPVTLAPLLAPARVRDPSEAVAERPGREQEIAVLFCDIRGFTALAEPRLPYDVVFLLNRYFATVGRAVEAAGGRLDKFVGDGAMALFGLGGAGAAEASRQALDAAGRIHAALATLGTELGLPPDHPLRVAIGVHTGPAVVGRMGFGEVTSLTAIGDTVNIASRLEALAKELDAALVVSDETARLSGIDLTGFEPREIAIRGRAAALTVRVAAAPQAA